MNIKMHQRNKFNYYLLSLFKKDKCEICGSADCLELHHNKLFSDLLYETLQFLNLEEKDTDEYTDIELTAITDIMLGKQIQCTYIMLCQKCHDDVHNLDENNHMRFYNLKVSEKKRIEEIKKNEYLKNYIPTLLNKRLNKAMQKELVEKIGLKDGWGRLQKSIGIMQKHIKENFGYSIISKQVRINGTLNTVWIIS